MNLNNELISHSSTPPCAWRITRSAFIWTRVLGTPFWVMINMLTFILYKDLHISPFQITAIVALKPMSSLLAPYWSQVIYQRPELISSNLVWANILRYLPFIFIPWIDSMWFIIFAFGLYMTLHRAVIPGWVEMLKRNLPETTQEQTIGYGSTIDYCGNAAMTLALGVILDHSGQAWRWLFPAMAILGLSSTWFLFRLPILPKTIISPALKVKSNRFNIKEHLIKPWRQSWKLIRERIDFSHYLIGFMLGGAGLMILQPALPIFFVDTLNLSYVEMGLALALCKGIGVAFTTPFWAKLFRKIDIFYFSGLVTLTAVLFPLLLLLSPAHLSLLYFAYILYGVMQAGSELSWHMSGIVFAKEKESSAFSSTNVLMVGIRGCIFPALGAFLMSATSSTSVMLIGAGLSLLSTWYLIRFCLQKKLNLV